MTYKLNNINKNEIFLIGYINNNYIEDLYYINK